MEKFNEGELVADLVHGHEVGLVGKTVSDGSVHAEFLFDDGEKVTDASGWRNSDEVRRPSRSELENHARNLLVQANFVRAHLVALAPALRAEGVGKEVAGDFNDAAVFARNSVRHLRNATRQRS